MWNIQRSHASYKDIGIRQLEFVASVQFLYQEISNTSFQNYGRLRLQLDLSLEKRVGPYNGLTTSI